MNKASIVFLSLAVVTVSLILSSCAQPASPASPTTTTITSVSQIPAGTWTCSTTRSSQFGSVDTYMTLVTTGAATAIRTDVVNMTAYIMAQSSILGEPAAVSWGRMRDAANPGETYSADVPYTITSAHVLNEAVMAISTVTLSGNTLTVTVTEANTDPVTLVFRKR